MDWLKKIIDSAENPSQDQTNKEHNKNLTLDSTTNQKNTTQSNNLILDKKLTLANEVFVKFEGEGKVLIQNINSESAVEFSKDSILILFEFYCPEDGYLVVKEFIKNWPPESHEELIKSINILITGNILTEIL